VSTDIEDAPADQSKRTSDLAGARIGMLAPVSWSVPPAGYGPWEQVVSLLTEGLVGRGLDVTLFATADSSTTARLSAICPRPTSVDPELDPKVWEYLHISEIFEHASEFDLIHNHFDFMPLAYSGLVRTPVVTTIHGFSSEKILAVYQKYNRKVHYVSISNADRHPSLHYDATVYHGIDLDRFTPRTRAGDYLLYFGRIHHDKGAREAIEVAHRSGRRLLLAGIIQDQGYYEREVAPHLDGKQIHYIGAVGPSKRDELLGGAFALLHLINFNEPFGLSIVESMACGTPVIGWSRGSIPEVISHGESGIIVNSIDQAVEAVAEVSRMDRSRVRAYAEKRFCKERMIEDYLNVYRKILA
jgi:glycosyltransferase involved in cell wall biosynthesis